MAIVKVGQIKKSLDKAIAYITRDDKTRDKDLVSSSWVCPQDPQLKDPKTLADAIMRDNENSMAGIKANTTLARHIIQSFDPEDNIDPATAHGLGLEFAARLSENGAYKYVLATHVDRNHIHNHIIMCNTNAYTHYKMRLDKNTLMKNWTPISDELCQEYGFSVSPRHGQDTTQEEKTTTWLRSGDYYASLKGEGQKQRIRDTIDRACTETSTFIEWKETLRFYRVEATVRGNHITYTDLTTNRKYRDSKLGIAYDEQSIMMKLNHQVLKHISVNHKLVDKEDPEKIRIIIPLTHGAKRITVPKSMTTRTGQTIRIYFGQDAHIPVSDRHGKGLGKLSMRDMFAAFGRPAQTWSDLTNVDRNMPQIELNGVSVKQEKWIRRQTHLVSHIAGQAEALRMIARNGGNINHTVNELTLQLQQADETLTSLMIARQDVISSIVKNEDNENAENQLYELDEQMDKLEEAIQTINDRLQKVRNIRPDQTQQKSAHQPRI